MDRALCELEQAVASIVQNLKLQMGSRGLRYLGDDDLLVRTFAGSIESWTEFDPKPPRRIRRHEECLDCDTGWHHDDDGNYHTHCDVCNEMWPCQHAGEIDAEELSQTRATYVELARRSPRGRSRSEWGQLYQLTDTLTAEGALPPSEEVFGRVDANWRKQFLWFREHAGCWFADLATAYEQVRGVNYVAEDWVISHWQHSKFKPNEEDSRALSLAIETLGLGTGGTANEDLA